MTSSVVDPQNRRNAERADYDYDEKKEERNQSERGGGQKRLAAADS